MSRGEASGRRGSERAGAGAFPASSALPKLPTTSDGGFDFSSILAVADMLPVMIAYVNADQRIEFVNRPLAEWFERTRSSILGLTLRELIGEDAYAVRAPLIDKALRGERQFFASDFAHPSRGSLAVQTNYVPWVDGSGGVRGLLIMVQDVTEQRTAERALRESEERFRRVADQAPVLMWVTRLDRTRDFVNEAYVDFVGGTRTEAAKLDWRTRIHPDRRGVDRRRGPTRDFHARGPLHARRRRISLAEEQ
jgi:PAS domain S-box-containing protein